MPGKVEQTCQGAEGIGGGTVGQGPEPGRKSRQEVDKHVLVCCEDGWFEEYHPQEQEVFEDLLWGGGHDGG